MRTYTYQAGAIPRVIAAWSERIAHRETFSPLAACWYSEMGDLNRWTHIWPYESMAERERVRAAAMASGAARPHARVDGGAGEQDRCAGLVLAAPLTLSPLAVSTRR
ncbi:MAG: NIPSNAP family protein [Dehalococcoidia bacterium]